MLAAVILAAGGSTRMGRPKALLVDPDGIAFVARLIRTFADAGIDETVVVAADGAPIEAAAGGERSAAAARIVVNPDPSRGPLSSLWAGLEAIARDDLEAILMTPVDVPMVKVATVRAVVEAWRRTGAPVVRPAQGRRHGHPVLFDRTVFEELRRAPLEAGAKAVVRAHEHDLLNVEVDDEGCLTDVDTPADYRALFGD